ncbi:hypothetical protein ACFT8P_32750 [Streptomyces sp. NPDC057101]|uniref:hypothetical protein n=1 Tax=Streptomyces sp. NPDC057101 TaxID=3346020 RepID=UPI00362A4A4E
MLQLETIKSRHRPAVPALLLHEPPGERHYAGALFCTGRSGLPCLIGDRASGSLILIHSKPGAATLAEVTGLLAQRLLIPDTTKPRTARSGASLRLSACSVLSTPAPS